MIKMTLKQQAIEGYSQKYPNYSNWIRDGALFGFNTYLETVGGKLMSKVGDKLAYHVDNHLRTNSQSEFAKSCTYCFLDGLIFLPASIEMILETPIRKLTGKTKFKEKN
jgi:hypothetical protein